MENKNIKFFKNDNDPENDNIKHESFYDLKTYLLNKEISEGYPVYLLVYHFTKINYLLQFLGFGFYHSSIIIHDIEYFYGNTKEDKSGINNKLFCLCDKCTADSNFIIKGILKYNKV